MQKAFRQPEKNSVIARRLLAVGNLLPTDMLLQANKGKRGNLEVKSQDFFANAAGVVTHCSYNN
ncbi:MAG: hypothetical protein IJV35_10605 [Neisseriaceae bacterium]|nr:hypothetical protein [Neisseriaceae bacterium]